MTTLTDLVAFFVSMVTDFPAIRYFCMYAAFSITFCYILVITVFVALLSFDVKRIEAGQFDVIPCVANNKETTEEVWEEAGESMINKLITKYAEVLMLKPIKAIVIIISIGMTAFGIYGAINVDQSFNQLVLGLKGSAYVKYFGYFETGFPSGIPVNVVLDAPLNYTDSSLQQQYSNLSQIAIDNNYMESQTFNWMRDLLSWSKNENITASGRHFYPSLYLFLQENQHYLVDIKFHKNWLQDMLEWSVVRQKLVTVDNFYQNLEQFLMETPQISAYMKYNFTTDSFLLRSNTKETFKTCDGECFLIKASRFIILTKANHFSIYRRDAMLSLREDLRTKTDLPVYGVSYNYIYVEQFVVILPDTIRNLAICASAILLITLPYLVDPKVTFFVFSGFVCLMFELFGVMYLWDVSLNAISMIIIVMGIGFSVDYSAHIAHAFVICNEKTSERRVIYAMRTMGASVTMGGISTFVGVVTTAFAQSELFKIFFKMVFGIVVLGLIHGLVFLPVFLAVFCNYNVPMTVEVDEEEENGNLSPKKNKMNGEEELLTMEDIPDTDKML
uniref:SSD domain-containing protein n=1 Tax=Clytia hemisphaerica TaxID=252671 RepID=A0A7M5WVR2_9CNID